MATSPRSASQDKPAAKPAAKSSATAKQAAAKAEPAAGGPAAPRAAGAPTAPQASAVAVSKPAKELVKKERPRKPKVVRDSFTMPKAEYEALDQLKQRGALLGHPVKKSELLRAGVKALVGMADRELLSALAAVPAIKTGRPAKS